MKKRGSLDSERVTLPTGIHSLNVGNLEKNISPSSQFDKSESIFMDTSVKVETPDLVGSDAREEKIQCLGFESGMVIKHEPMDDLPLPHLEHSYLTKQEFESKEGNIDQQKRSCKLGGAETGKDVGKDEDHNALVKLESIEKQIDPCDIPDDTLVPNLSTNEKESGENSEMNVRGISEYPLESTGDSGSVKSFAYEEGSEGGEDEGSDEGEEEFCAEGKVEKSGGELMEYPEYVKKEVNQTTKKDGSETESNVSDVATRGTTVSSLNSDETNWCDVGVIRGTSCSVSSYHDSAFSEYDPNHEFINLNNLPNFVKIPKIQLEPGTGYRFRVAAINSHGRGPWSETSIFKTSLPGFPDAPSAIKISTFDEGARLSWEPPSNPAGTITGYAVCLAVKKRAPSTTEPGTPHQFIRVYSGENRNTIVPKSTLSAAYIDMSSLKPAVIFRIAAKNERGFGPAIQVRWVQEVVSSPRGSVKSY